MAVRTSDQIRRPGSPGSQPLVTVSDRQKIAIGHRGQKVGYLPDALPTNPETFTSRTTAIGVRRTSVSPLPPGATSVRIMVTIAPNTATGGTVNFLAYASEARASAGGIANSAGSFRGNMTNASHVWSSTFDVPLVNGNILWEATVSGTVNFNLNVYVIAVISE